MGATSRQVWDPEPRMGTVPPGYSDKSICWTRSGFDWKRSFNRIAQPLTLWRGSFIHGQPRVSNDLERLRGLRLWSYRCSKWPSNPRIFGTLAITLPSKHEGGDVCIFRGGTQVFATSQSSAFDISYIAWYPSPARFFEPWLTISYSGSTMSLVKSDLFLQVDV